MPARTRIAKAYDQRKCIVQNLALLQGLYYVALFILLIIVIICMLLEDCEKINKNESK